MFARFFLAIAMTLLVATPAYAATAPDMGSAAPYAVLGSTAVTASGTVAVNGDLGVIPGAISGTVSLRGNRHENDANAQSAQSSAKALYNSLLSSAAGTHVNRNGDEVGNEEIIDKGVYSSDSTLQFNGKTTLRGTRDDVFIFAAQQTMTFMQDSKIVLDGVQACNVFFVSRSSVQIKNNVALSGNLVALRDVVAGSANVNGRLFSTDGRIALTGSTVNRADCATPPPPVVCSNGSTVPAGSTCPTPPPPVVCSNGSTVPAGSTCPTPPPPVVCSNGSTVPAGSTCPVIIEPRPIPVGTARLIMPKHCVKRSFTVAVRGTNMVKATIYVDGHKKATKTASNGSRVNFRLDARDFSSRTHKVTVKVTMFNRAVKTLHSSKRGFKRCAVRHLRPHPAG